MAGAGYKLFNTGDVLLASEVNTYLQQQTVMVFASSAARTTALSGVLAEGMMSYLQDTNSVEVYNGSSWVNVGNAGDITGVTAGTGISGGGSSGDVTITNSMATAIDAKGDLIVGTGADTFDRLAVGTNGYTLVADSGETTGLKWAAPSGGDLVLITRNTFSAVATVDIDDVFSSTYNSYQIFIERVVSSQNADGLDLQFRYGTTTRTSTYYYSAARNTWGGTASTVQGSSLGVIYLGGIGTGSKLRGTIFIPNAGNSSDLHGNHLVVDKMNDMSIRGGFYQEDTRTWTGFRLKSSGGHNITGEVTVYGFVNS